MAPRGASWSLTWPHKARIHFGCGPLETLQDPRGPPWGLNKRPASIWDAGLLRLSMVPTGLSGGLPRPQQARIHFGCWPLKALNGPTKGILGPYQASKGPLPFWMRAS
eukprot:3161671-Karenia_brevis.AAC.1